MKQKMKVVAALIRDKNRILICKRPPHKAQGNLWEFVGGKVEQGETPQQALVRECQEELAIEIVPKELFFEIQHEYDDRIVDLMVFCAEIKSGIPKAIEHQEICWATVQTLGQYDFCPADLPVLEKIQQQG